MKEIQVDCRCFGKRRNLRWAYRIKRVSLLRHKTGPYRTKNSSSLSYEPEKW